MSDMTTTFALAGFSLAGLSIVIGATLKGWQGWLEIKRLELTGSRAPERSQALDLIEVSDLKERIRKLEAIAACVDI